VSWLTILGLAVGLALDAFAVAAAIGLALPRVTGRHVFRLAWHFGLFQFLMPVIGWLAGKSAADLLAAWDHWVAFGLLAFLGGKMLYEAFAKIDRAATGDPTRGLVLLGLSIVVSIDALAAGLTMAFLRVRIWMPALLIGLVAGGLTIVGIRFGDRLGARWGKRAEIAGGLVLIGLGVQILVSHLLE